MSARAREWRWPGAGTLVALLVVACLSDRQGNLTGLPKEYRTLAEAAGVPSIHVVVGIVNFAFTPTAVTVPRGATVTWVNCETDPNLVHTATADDGTWSSALFRRGEIYTRIFADSGTYPYHCEPHPWMKAQVVVQ